MATALGPEAADEWSQPYCRARSPSRVQPARAAAHHTLLGPRAGPPIPWPSASLARSRSTESRQPSATVASRRRSSSSTAARCSSRTVSSSSSSPHQPDHPQAFEHAFAQTEPPGPSHLTRPIGCLSIRGSASLSSRDGGPLAATTSRRRPSTWWKRPCTRHSSLGGQLWRASLPTSTSTTPLLRSPR